ncbi:glycosyltransferase family 2 protein [Priestia megaterium]|uniref:glycosyltransferase family 2 protein n=1 Tax=Priestia megaterium TaxID=1404 RepID=UPI002E242191|nr:glycosyltransferase [Priestia megaterium]
MPAISIIVPVYNVEEYLEKCIDSILKQTFKDFELILVNDGSTDNCGEICDKYVGKDNRVRVIHKKNGGLSDARNSGIEAAKGHYIGFVDSDDWIEPNMYEILYTLCVENGADISTCSINIWDKENKRKCWGASNTTKIFDSRIAIKYMYDDKLSGFTAWNKLYNKNVFKNIRFPKGRIYEDAAIMYKIYDNSNQIIFIDNPLYNYIYRRSSITRSSFSEKRFDVVLNYEETYIYMQKNYPEMCEKLDNIYFASLRNMVVDIVNERSLLSNYKYIRKISGLIKQHNNKLLKNKSIPLSHKMLAQLIAWCPVLGILFYKIRISTGALAGQK